MVAIGLQVPKRFRDTLPVVTGRFIPEAHAAGLRVDDEMRELLDIGVDGIINDRPDRLTDVLASPPSPTRSRRMLGRDELAPVAPLLTEQLSRVDVGSSLVIEFDDRRGARGGPHRVNAVE